jgi:hypothetical protein
MTVDGLEQVLATIGERTLVDRPEPKRLVLAEERALATKADPVGMG